MKNSDYWKERFKQLEAAANKNGTDYYHEIEEQFTIAQRQIEKEVLSWYQRFATNNEVTMSEARQMLNAKQLAELKWNVKEYIKYGEENALDGRWMKQLENASSRFHITRLEALKLQTQQVAEVLYGNQTDGLDAMMKRVYLDGYYHTAFEVQKGFNVGWDIAGVDQSRLEKIISKPWAADGKNFSDRIWSNKKRLINEVHTQLTQTCILGKAPDDAIKNIAKKMGVSKSNAGRLVMTESAYFASASQKDCFNELDVEKFEILATLDPHTSAICQELDGKVFDMKEYEPGVTAPPFHVWCRSMTIPYFDDDFEPGERAARGEDGKTYYVPSDVKYPEWKKNFVDGGNKDGLKVAGDSGIINVVSDVQSVKDALINQVGFNNVENSFSLIDGDLQIANTNQLIKLEQKFGCVHNSMATICSVENGPSTLAYVSSKVVNPTDQTLSLCPKYFSSKVKLIMDNAGMITSGQSMPAALADKELMIYTVTHEYGHILQNTLVRKAFEKAGWVASNANAFVNTARKTQKAMCKWYFDLNAKIKSGCYNEIVAIAKETNESFSLANNLSEYGCSSSAEFFAEVFANSQLSKPNELGNAMNVWLERKGLVIK